ncbi:hypothetical protein V8C35DRAFT_308924 [Trichoderma chlorosporum]
MSPHLVDIVTDGDTLIILPYAKVAAEDAVSGAEDSVRAAKRVKTSNGNDAGRIKWRFIVPDDYERRDLKEAGDQGPKEAETGSTEAVSQEVFHFKVSMKHLALASPRAKLVLQGPFKESTPHESDGLLHWELEPIFEPAAFQTVLHIIHAQNDKLPPKVTLEFLAHVAAIADDLQCHGSVGIFASLWAQKLKITTPSEINEELARIILISSVFGLRELFEHATLQAILSSKGEMPVFGLPISSDTLDAIEETRINLMSRRLKRLHKIADRYNDQSLCVFCGAGSLGLLHINMRKNHLPIVPTLEPISMSLRHLEARVKRFSYPTNDYRELCPYNNPRSYYPARRKEHPDLREDIDEFLENFYSNIGKLKLKRTLES